ncbi:MAG TPA: hypothetical protein VLE69_01900 [Candidatus Saccharimonadales bacterium]|nr:hypothetical protein [Candidatus Saccharimonadales bacterium]
MKRLSNRGDTIVEVLIAIVVVSMVLGAAFVLSNRSAKNTRQAQERGEALKYVESQIEQIKANKPTGSGFCYAKDGSGVSPSGGATCSFGSIPNGYRISITQSSGTYTVTAVWDNALGAGQDQMVMYYKIT